MGRDDPLFVPLKLEHFCAFARGEKTFEWRRHGPVWNEDVCWVGRPVILSLGYRGLRRLPARVISFHTAAAQGSAIYPDGTLCAVIGIRLEC